MEEIRVGEQNVFTFWNGPLKEAPPVVRAAIGSWRKGAQEAGYQHHIIGEVNLDQWEHLLGVDGEKLRDFRLHGKYVPDHKWRKYTDVLRLILLKHFNGIWVDSTVFLMRPLAEWVPDPSKFGGLQLPKGAGPVMESWLIVSGERSPFVSSWADFFTEYSLRVNEDAPQWRVKKFSIPWWVHRFSKHVQGGSDCWFSEWFIRLYPRSPYYAIYYSFSWMLRREGPKHGIEQYKVFLPYSLQAWKEFNSIQNPGLKVGELDEGLREYLEILPFLKLDWKRSPKESLRDLPHDSALRHFWLKSMDFDGSENPTNSEV